MSATTNPHDGSIPNPLDGAVDRGAIARGHENDGYDNMSVFSVPLMVVVFFALAFTTVSIVFYFVSKSEVDPNANPMAVKDNEAPLDDKLDRIKRSKDFEKDQPRLEPLVLRQGDPRAITEPKKATGNSPELHPEDIHVNQKNTPELYKTGPIDKEKSASRITIDDAMKLAVEKNLFPVQKLGTPKPTTTNVPSEANAGRGAGESSVTPPKLPNPPGGGK
jgi:hypothetical protein